MKLFFCSKQEEVMTVLRQGQWPEGCDQTLHAHVAVCQECNDLVLVTQTLQQARRETMQEPGFGPNSATAAMLWWRSELRLRRGAVERMTRPVAVTENFALIGMMIAVVGLATWQWKQIADWLLSLTNLASGNTLYLNDPELGGFGMASWLPMVLMAGLGTFVVVWGVAVLLLAERD
ncbi:MAG TPA: hypothetical protein VK699_20965 [Terriglobales bacterium]|jgi:hypothetical protein|nr:hypothetical protein [Terriglobales bacterium]